MTTPPAEPTVIYASRDEGVIRVPPLKIEPKKDIIPAYQIEDWENELRALMTRANWLKKRLGIVE